jgi:TonB-linked SusC/RagA family outer membrane protein
MNFNLNYHSIRNGRCTIIFKTIRIMKLVFFLTVIASLSSYSTGLAQTVNLDLKDSRIETALSSIREQTGYRFIYKESLLKKARKVNIHVKNERLETVLQMLLKDQPLDFTIYEGTIVIKDKSFNPRADLATTEKQVAELQQQIITGKVTDENDHPLEGVSVTIKGTSIGTTTGVDGMYSLSISENQTVLVFSMIGYVSQEVKITQRSTVNITLKPQVDDLNAVIVVAYGTSKKSSFTGSAATIGEEVFKNRPVTEISQALTGTTPGLQVGTSNGQPGSEPTLRIRGIGSFNAGNSPLIVLDGMPYDNAFSSINPNDVESITVLKDASSAALYGARGANGVILINTKKGKTDKPKVVASYNYGMTSRQSAEYQILNDRDYMELYWEAHRNTFMLNGYSESDANALAGSALLSGLGYNPYLMDAPELFTANGKLNSKAINHWMDDTDWYGAITQLGKRHDANISISGKNKNTDYYTSLGYMKEEGYIIGSAFNRISAKANANSKITNWLKIGSNMNISHSTADGQQNETSGAISNPFRSSRFMGNVFPIHIHNPSTGEYIRDANGNKIPDFGSGWSSADGAITIGSRDAFANSNYPHEVHNIYNGYQRQTINAKGYAEASIIKNLKLTLNGGIGSNMYRGWSGGYVYEQKGNAGSSSQDVSNTTTWTFQQLLNYTAAINKHRIEALAGHESYQYTYHYLSSSMKTQSIIGDNFEYANFTEINALPNSYTNNYRVEGYLSRLNYDYDGKYFASVSYRKDASSRFYKDVRWGNFWSAGIGWGINRERFMQNVKFVDNLKLRASYGVVGNDDLSGYYPWRATYSVNDNGEPGYVQSSLGNKLLTWETSKNFDAAVEFGLFKDRFRGSVEYFYRVSSDLLFNVPQPISSGINNIDVNAGSMYNKGVEVVLDGDVYKSKNFQLGLNLNATFLKNKISQLPLEPYPTSVYKIEQGHSRYDFWLREWYGVNPDNGYNLFKADVDKFNFNPGELKDIDGVLYTENIEKSLYSYAGTAMPTATGGFGVNVGYKGFNLKVNFYYQLGGLFYDAAYGSYMTGSLSYFAQHQDLLKRWKAPGDVTNVARVTTGTDRVNIEAANSTRWLVSSNMLEMTNVNLSYKFPKQLLQSANIADATLYIAADNSLLLTARKGMYPRRNFYSGYIGNSDVYPPSGVVAVGLSVTF